MRGLAEDVWGDLRERKLWPVALALVLALALVPLLLLEPAAEPAPDPAGTGAGSPGRAAAAVAVESPAMLVARGSDLDVFTPRDPFARPQRRRARRASSGSRSRGTASPTAGAPAPASSPAGASPASPTPPTAASPPGTPSSPGSGASAGDRPVGDQSSRFTDVVDIRFGRRGEERTRSHVVRMTALPNDERPVLTFLGPSVSGRSAVFLLAPDLAKQAGDGTCDPSPTNCRMISLRTDREHDQHFLTDAQGRKYSIRLISIDRIPVADALERQSRIRSQSASKTRQ